MESSDEHEIIAEPNLADNHVTVDFSLLMGEDEDLGNNDDSKANQEAPDILMSDDSDSDSGDDESIEDIEEKSVLSNSRKVKPLIEEETLQSFRRDVDCITCDQLDHKMGELEDKKQHETEGFEFADCNVTTGTISKNAKLITRSDSEVKALKSLYEAELNAEVHTVNKIDDSESDKKSETIIPDIQTTVSITKPAESVHDDVFKNTETEASPQETLLSAPEKNHNIEPGSPKHLSPKSWRKRAIRVPAGKKYKHTIFNEDVLAAYDIIDRREMKSIENITPSNSIFSLSQIKSKLSAWIPDRNAKTSSTDGVNVHTPARSTVVQFSVEKTTDGEAMQVITLSPTCDEDKQLPSSTNRRDSSMIIYVDNISDGENDNNDYISDDDSDRSSVSDFEASDTVDSIGRKSGSYDISHEPSQSDNMSNYKEVGDNVLSEESKDDVADLPKPDSNRFKGPSRISKSFGGVDSARPEVDRKRRITMDISLFPTVDLNVMKSVIPMDKNRLKKKTLPMEPFHCITDGYPMVLPSYPSDRRSLIALEVYTTERTFVRGLEIIVLLFKTRIDIAGYLDKKEIESVFSNVTSILEFNKNILDEIFERISAWSDEQCIGDIFLQYKDGFRMYAEYCKSYDTGEALMKQKIKKNKNFENFINDVYFTHYFPPTSTFVAFSWENGTSQDADVKNQSCYTNPVCIPGLTLQSYLITVIQRIPRYILLLKDLLKRTPEEHPDHNNLSQAVPAMEKIASFINEQLKQAQCQKALEVLQTQITGLKALYIPGRTLVHEGPVCLLTSKNTYQCVLFNDLLVFAVKSASKQSEVELALELKTVWFEDLKTLDPQTTKTDAIGIYTPDRPYTMYVGSSNEKKIWLENLRITIIKYLYPELEKMENVDLEQREKLSYTYKGGSLYSGTYFNAKRHGEGVMMWPNQMTYRGKWLDDERNGEGVLEYVTGEVYEGEWKDHKQDGLGTFKYSNGDILSGQWKKGVRHGEIFINYTNGDKFAGNWKQDCIEGQGQLVCINGFTYEGEWKRNLMHGRGKLKMSDGSQYSGTLKNGKFHGKGELTYPDGSEYKGEFERGERCGHGSYKIPGGSSYDGQWMHDLKDGRGKMFYENGDEYEGLWVQDMRTGQGIIFYSCGGSYRGQWINGMRHGSGTMENKDGSSYDGEWNNDKMCGHGTIKFPNGEMFKGNFQDNIPNGKGILTKPGGWFCDGTWQQGKQHGRCTLKDTFNEYSYEGDWNHGLKDGLGVETINENIYEGAFLDNLRNGEGQEGLQDGTVYVGSWSCGQKHGKGIRKLINGLQEEQLWYNGCLVHSPVQLTPRELPTLQRW